MSNKNILHKMCKCSIYELHAKTTIPYNQLLRWNKGIKQFDIGMLAKLAKYCKMSPGEFVDLYLKEQEAE
jgi:hypothetical protein